MIFAIIITRELHHSAARLVSSSITVQHHVVRKICSHDAEAPSVIGLAHRVCGEDRPKDGRSNRCDEV